MDAARILERKRFALPTTSRTYEIISSIHKRKGDKEAQMKKEEEAEAEKLKNEAAMKEDVKR